MNSALVVNIVKHLFSGREMKKKLQMQISQVLILDNNIVFSMLSVDGPCLCFRLRPSILAPAQLQ